MNKEEIKKIQKFTDLIVWQEGHKLVLMIYKITKIFPTEEKFGLVDQMRRAVVSFTSNIAEGFTRKSGKEKSQFYHIAKSSMTEIQNQLIIAKDVGYLSKDAFNELAQQSVIANRLLGGLLKATRQKKYEV
jgi:four helix bundle protein